MSKLEELRGKRAALDGALRASQEKQKAKGDQPVASSSKEGGKEEDGGIDVIGGVLKVVGAVLAALAAIFNMVSKAFSQAFDKAAEDAKDLSPEEIEGQIKQLDKEIEEEMEKEGEEAVKESSQESSQSGGPAMNSNEGPDEALEEEKKVAKDLGDLGDESSTDEPEKEGAKKDDNFVVKGFEEINEALTSLFGGGEKQEEGKDSKLSSLAKQAVNGDDHQQDSAATSAPSQKQASKGAER